MAIRKLTYNLQDAEPHASFQVVIKSLSPMKKGRKCESFDEKSSPSRFVGFSQKQLDALKRMKDGKNACSPR